MASSKEHARATIPGKRAAVLIIPFYALRLAAKNSGTAPCDPETQRLTPEPDSWYSDVWRRFPLTSPVREYVFSPIQVILVENSSRIWTKRAVAISSLPRR